MVDIHRQCEDELKYVAKISEDKLGLLPPSVILSCFTCEDCEFLMDDTRQATV